MSAPNVHPNVFCFARRGETEPPNNYEPTDPRRHDLPRRYLVEAALARGHQVTLFNRGQHNPELYPDVEKLRGDRDGGLDALRGRRWDAVVDTSGYMPRVVRASAELLADAVEHYTFISSISVYPHFRRMGLDESAPVGTLDDPTVEEITGESYGPLKALCEQAVEQALPGRTLVVRQA